MMRITTNQEKYEMKIPFSVEIVSLSLVASVFAGSALAEPKKTEREETRGAIAGLVVGAAVAGPIGAGVGAIMGGAVVGKLFGYHRINRELETRVVKLEADNDINEIKMHTEISNLDAELKNMIEIQTASWNSRQLPIQFRTASSDIEQHYQEQLNEIARILSRNLDTSVSLSGFADRRGDLLYNQNLSENRVANVHSYLISRGVNGNQIVTKAFGESQPLSTEETSESHFFDRRVVMQFSFDLDAYLASR
jgi:sortase system peptidoglycan-associated protein